MAQKIHWETYDQDLERARRRSRIDYLLAFDPRVTPDNYIKHGGAKASDRIRSIRFNFKYFGHLLAEQGALRLPKVVVLPTTDYFDEQVAISAFVIPGKSYSSDYSTCPGEPDKTVDLIDKDGNILMESLSAGEFYNNGLLVPMERLIERCKEGIEEASDLIIGKVKFIGEGMASVPARDEEYYDAVSL